MAKRRLKSWQQFISFMCSWNFLKIAFAWPIFTCWKCWILAIWTPTASSLKYWTLDIWIELSFHFTSWNINNMTRLWYSNFTFWVLLVSEASSFYVKILNNLQNNEDVIIFHQSKQTNVRLLPSLSYLITGWNLNVWKSVHQCYETLVNHLYPLIKKSQLQTKRIPQNWFKGICLTSG